MSDSHPIPFFPYRLWFVYLEPLLSLTGAYQIGFGPYLSQVASLGNFEAPIEPPPIKIALHELSGLIILTAFQGFFLLGNCKDEKTWSWFVKGHLLSDTMHLLVMLPMGLDNYWQFWTWNSMNHLGNYGFVYLAMTIRISYLLGLGFKTQTGKSGEKQKAG